MSNFDIDIPSLILIFGGMRLGKSHLIRYLMYNLRKKFDYGIVFCNTCFEDSSFDYVPTELVYPEYSSEALENLMKIQANLVEKGVKKNAYVIFDDALFDDQFKCNSLKKLTTQLRHYNITLIMSSQYANCIPQRMKANSMHTFIFHTDNKNNLEALYNAFGQLFFDSYNDFKKYLLEHTGDYKFIYYSNMLPQSNLTNNFHSYKAPAKIPRFRLKINNKTK